MIILIKCKETIKKDGEFSEDIEIFTSKILKNNIIKYQKHW